VKRILLLALVLVALIAAFASQTWFVVPLTSGSALMVSGLEAFPSLGPTLAMDALAIALVLYLKSRWRAFLLLLGIVALSSLAVGLWPAVTGQDLGVLAPTLEKATGVSTWVAQLDQVVVGPENTIWALVALILVIALNVLQAVAAIYEIRRTATTSKAVIRGAGRKEATSQGEKGKRSVPRQGNTPSDLWKETNPSGL
jgi:hypothetical protein